MLWSQRGKAAVLLDGQFGSTGKGQIAAWLSLYACPEGVNVATTNAGAQAGHTTRYNGRIFVCYHLPTVAVMQERYAGAQPTMAYLNAGSIIDPQSLGSEISDTGFPKDKIIIHPRAATITAEDRERERAAGSATERSASTQKGVGSAISRKIMRTGTLAAEAFGRGWQPPAGPHVGVLGLNEAMLRDKAIVTVEVPQGFGLSLNHGFQYPFVTSRDCYLNSALSDAGIHPSFLGKVCMVVRTHPIRVGAVTNELGEPLAGSSSGPFPGDCVELDWAKDLPGIEPERTTVTKRVRRIASWSDHLYRQALSFNRPDIIALTFIDYLGGPDDLRDLLGHMWEIEAELGLTGIRRLFSWGNTVEKTSDKIDDAYGYLESKRG